MVRYGGSQIDIMVRSMGIFSATVADLVPSMLTVTKEFPIVAFANSSGIYEATGEHECLSHISQLLDEAQTVVGIGSARASLEANFALQTLVGKENFFSGLSTAQAEISDLLLSVLKKRHQTSLPSPRSRIVTPFWCSARIQPTMHRG